MNENKEFKEDILKEFKKEYVEAYIQKFHDLSVVEELYMQHLQEKENFILITCSQIKTLDILEDIVKIFRNTQACFKFLKKEDCCIITMCIPLHWRDEITTAIDAVQAMRIVSSANANFTQEYIWPQFISEENRFELHFHAYGKLLDNLKGKFCLNFLLLKCDIKLETDI